MTTVFCDGKKVAELPPILGLPEKNRRLVKREPILGHAMALSHNSRILPKHLSVRKTPGAVMHKVSTSLGFSAKIKHGLIIASNFLAHNPVTDRIRQAGSYGLI